MATEKTRYSDEELEEFRGIINEKLAIARNEYQEAMDRLNNKNSNDVADTSPTYKMLEEGTDAMEKEELIRIQNKTYGIDRLTGELIPADRLRAVPHATLSVASKEKNRNH